MGKKMNLQPDCMLSRLIMGGEAPWYGRQGGYLVDLLSQLLTWLEQHSFAEIWAATCGRLSSELLGGRLKGLPRKQNP